MIEIGKNYKIKEHVEHQGIGGKEIHIEMELAADEVEERGWGGNIACLHFTIRRMNSQPAADAKLYYGHVGNLGYVVCEDELYE